MLVEFVHENGKRYTVPASQVVVASDGGAPCAVTYVHAGVIVHTNANERDFQNVLSQLKIKNVGTDRG